MWQSSEVGDSLAVVLEVGNRRAFASATDYPGWCRSAKDGSQAVVALGSYRRRFAPVCTFAGVELPEDASFDVVEELPGTATTDFGAPGAIAAVEHRSLDPDEGKRLAGFLIGGWTVFDGVAATSPSRLVKGPRGGGRDREPMIRHVIEAESAYVRKIALRLETPADHAGWITQRAAIVDAVAVGTSGETKWPLAYAVRRIAWHVLDHAWEMQDRS